MNLSLIAAAIWAIAGTITALMPMRAQMVPGLALLVSAPFLLVWIGWENGWGWTVAGLAAFASMMRNPLRYLYQRMRGEKPELPPELRS